MERLSHYVEGRWHRSTGTATPIEHAVTGAVFCEASSADLDFGAILRYGRQTGGPALRRYTFHERARMLRALAQHLLAHKEQFYAASVPTGATRGDSWIDIEGGIGTLFTYASRGRKECPDKHVYLDGRAERLSKLNTFSGQHVCVPLEGVAVHINAFNFPCWGMLEKFAPSFLAGMPVLIKPATASCFVTEAVVRSMSASGILPEGALQLICGSVGDTFQHLTSQDVVTFTGSKSTGVKLRTHARVIDQAVRFNMESDSLNCSVLGPDAAPGTEEFALYVRELVREMTVKAGQKCTVIRRAIVPKAWEEAVLTEVSKALATITVGDPSANGVQMGPLVNRAHRDDVREQIVRLCHSAEVVSQRSESLERLGVAAERGAFIAPTLLRCGAPLTSSEVHEVEAFGPVATVMGYSSFEEAIEIARLGAGSLVGSLFTADDEVASAAVAGLGPFHGRLLIVNRECAGESTGHGSPLPMLVHGGPGRAGGGEELGGMRSVLHYMQRVAVQGSPTTLSRVTHTYIGGGACHAGPVHPFRRFYEELEIGETLRTGTRTFSDGDVQRFAELSGDFFYAHMDEQAARESLFGQRVVHGYLVLSAAAGLFVDPAPGPVVANYGLERLRFIAPVFIGDTIEVRLTCKDKTPRDGEGQGVVAWDVEVTNQRRETVAVYTILTLVRFREPEQL